MLQMEKFSSQWKTIVSWLQTIPKFVSSEYVLHFNMGNFGLTFRMICFQPNHAGGWYFALIMANINLKKFTCRLKDDGQHLVFTGIWNKLKYYFYLFLKDCFKYLVSLIFANIPFFNCKESTCKQPLLKELIFENTQS